MLTALKCRWFSGRGSIGVVMAETEFQEIQYYIGAADGLNERIDINLIMSFGARFPDDAGRLLLELERRKWLSDPQAQKEYREWLKQDRQKRSLLPDPLQSK